MYSLARGEFGLNTLAEAERTAGYVFMIVECIEQQRALCNASQRFHKAHKFHPGPLNARALCLAKTSKEFHEQELSRMLGRP